MYDYKAFGIRDQVYIIHFSSGVVKVGRTKNFDRRLYEHTKTATLASDTVAGNWHMYVDDSYDAEHRLIATAKALGGTALPRKYEWFTGVDFEELAQRARDNYGDYADWLAAEDALIPERLGRFEDFLRNES